MGIFGLSSREKFVQGNASNLAAYLKNNSVKLGGEAYAKCQILGILPAEIDKSLLWYFWSVIYAFRVAHDALALKRGVNDATLQILFDEFIEVDNRYFRPIEHSSYVETFTSVNVAMEIIKANVGKSVYEQSSMFMLHVIKSMTSLATRDQKYTVVELLTTAATSFPALSEVIERN